MSHDLGFFCTCFRVFVLFFFFCSEGFFNLKKIARREGRGLQMSWRLNFIIAIWIVIASFYD